MKRLLPAVTLLLSACDEGMNQAVLERQGGVPYYVTYWQVQKTSDQCLGVLSLDPSSPVGPVFTNEEACGPVRVKQGEFSGVWPEAPPDKPGSNEYELSVRSATYTYKCAVDGVLKSYRIENFTYVAKSSNLESIIQVLGNPQIRVRRWLDCQPVQAGVKGIIQ